MLLNYFYSICSANGQLAPKVKVWFRSLLALLLQSRPLWIRYQVTGQRPRLWQTAHIKDLGSLSSIGNTEDVFAVHCLVLTDSFLCSIERLGKAWRLTLLTFLCYYCNGPQLGPIFDACLRNSERLGSWLAFRYSLDYGHHKTLSPPRTLSLFPSTPFISVRYIPN